MTFLKRIIELAILLTHTIIPYNKKPIFTKHEIIIYTRKRSSARN